MKKGRQQENGITRLADTGPERKIEEGKMEKNQKNRNPKETKRIREYMKQYQDIIDLPRPVSRKYPQMPMEDRAAQFAPFAALSGHGEVIRQTEASHVGEEIERVEYEGEI